MAIVSLFVLSAFLIGQGSLRVAYAPTAATITEWTIPTPNSVPTGLALDPSGKCCWFVELTGNKVAQLDPDMNTFREWAIPTANSQTTGLATTMISGSVAVFGAEFATNKVFLLFPSTGTFKEYTLPTVDSGPEYISIEPGGTDIRAWFSEFGGPANGYTRNSMGEIIYQPTTGDAFLYEWTLPAGAGGGANGVYAAPGVIWLAGVSGIVKWDRAASQFTTWSIPAHPSTTAAFVDVDSLGQVWYTSRSPGGASTNNYVGVLRGDNTFKEWQVPTAGADLRVISISPVTQTPWVAEQGGDKVANLDPSAGGIVTGSAPVITPFAPVLGALVTTTTGPVAPSVVVVPPTSGPNSGSTTGQFTEWTLAGGSHPHDVILDIFGDVWILESSINKVARLTISGPDFILSPSSGTISIAQGASGTLLITGTSILGFSGAVTLSVTGPIPSEVTFGFSPNPISIPSGGTASSTLTINVGGGAPTGSSIITVSGTGGPTRTTSFTLTITSGADFSLSLSSASLSVGSGGSVTNTITVTSIGGFNSPVDLTTEGALPTGVHVGFSPSPVTPPAGGSVTSVATISVDAGTPAAAHIITIKGASGALAHTQTMTLTITVVPDFTIGASPSSLTVSQGSSGTSTINIGSVNGFSSAVTLAYSWLGTAPSDVSVSLPGPVTPPSGSSASSTLTLSAGASASTGSFTLTVTGTSGSLAHSVSMGVQINPAGTTTTGTTTAPPPTPCLIATATYGSELSPEVQLLRSFRDNAVLRTRAGANFMTAFNAWYYSFSPNIARYIADRWAERTAMKILLYPLIGILALSSKTFSAAAGLTSEFAVLLAGLVASSLIGAVYVGLPLGIARTRIRLRNATLNRMATRVLSITLLTSLGALIFGEVLMAPALLMLSSAIVVLSTLFLSASITSSLIARRLRFAM